MGVISPHEKRITDFCKEIPYLIKIILSLRMATTALKNNALKPLNPLTRTNLENYNAIAEENNVCN